MIGEITSEKSQHPKAGGENEVQIISTKSQLPDANSLGDEGEFTDWIFKKALGEESADLKGRSECDDNEKSDNIICKWEWFNSQNLELMLESLRLKIKGTKEYTDDLKLFNRLRHYALSADFASCKCPVTYRSKYYGLKKTTTVGRMFGYTNSLHHENKEMYASLQNFPRWVRSGLASDFYWDLDLVNAHPSILFGLCKVKKISYTENLRVLVEKRDSVLRYIAARFSLPESTAREQAKHLLTIIFYGGSIEMWMGANDVIDGNLTSDLFDLEKYKKEITEITRLLWEVESFSDICPQIPLIKMQVVERHPESERKQRFSFLSLVLQTEECIILAKIEAILHDQEREMDVFIHDGGLIRKMIKITEVGDGIGNHWRTFDPLQFNIKTDLHSYEWESEFPPALLRFCEAELKIQSPDRYGSLKLAIKPFDPDWKSQIKPSLPRDSYLRKTFHEMEYFYERTMNLCYIGSQSEYLYAGRFYTEQQIRCWLPEHCYIDVLKDAHDKNVNLDSDFDEMVEGIQQPKIKGISNKQNFWGKYCYERDKRSYDRIIFCEEELECANMKDPYSNYIPVNIEQKYMVLFTGINSFSVMRDEHQSEFLSSALEIKQIEFLKNDVVMDISGSYDPNVISVEQEPLFPWVIPTRYHVGENTIRKGACFLNHFYHLVGSKSAEFIFLLKFFAKIVQYPKVLDEACGLILFSPEEGVGKSFAAGMMLDLLAPFAKETHDTKDVFGDFGNLQENCLLLHIEDADAAEMKHFGSFFKNRLTARTITVEKKHQDKVTRLNLCRFLITTNTLNIFQIGETDRRYTIIRCSTSLVNQKQYFRSLSKIWSMKSTKRAVLCILNSIDLTGFSVEKDRPKTTPYKTMLSKSISPVKKFVIGLSLWLHGNRYDDQNEISEEGALFVSRYQTRVNADATGIFWTPSQSLFELFTRWNTSEFVADAKKCSLTVFGKSVREMSPELSTKKDTEGKACLPIVVPKMLQEAIQFGFNEIDDALPMNQLFLIPMQSVQLGQNLPMLNVRKKIQGNEKRMNTEGVNSKSTTLKELDAGEEAQRRHASQDIETFLNEI